jgi:hypothetical protein
MKTRADWIRAVLAACALLAVTARRPAGTTTGTAATPRTTRW